MKKHAQIVLATLMIGAATFFSSKLQASADDRPLPGSWQRYIEVEVNGFVIYQCGMTGNSCFFPKEPIN